MAVVPINFPSDLARVGSIEALRGLPSFDLDQGALVIVDGVGLWSWDDASITVDDSNTHLQPDDRTALQAGRWFNLTRVPTGQDSLVTADFLAESYVGDIPIVDTDKAPQGHSLVKTGRGAKYLFVKQREDATSGTPDDGTDPGTGDEAISQPFRFIQVAWPSCQLVTQTTAQVGFSHQGIETWANGLDDIYIVTGASAEAVSTALPEGKGFAEIKWRGAATDATDVSLYQVFPARASGLPRCQYGNNYGICSKDGRFFIAVVRDSSQPIRADATPWVFVYDAAKVRAAAAASTSGTDATSVEPEFAQWSFQWPAGTSESNCGQDYVCLFDPEEQQYLFHIIIGRVHPTRKQFIQTYDLSGRLLRTTEIAGEKHRFGAAGMLNYAAAFPTQTDIGVPYSFEVECLTADVDDGALYFAETVKFSGYSGQTVSLAAPDGSTRNFTPSGGQPAIGEYPSVRSNYWMWTTRAANMGAFDPTVQYAAAGAKTYSARPIWRLAPKKGLAGEYPASGNPLHNSTSQAALAVGDNTRGITYNAGRSLQVYQDDEVAGRSDLRLSLFGSALQLRDCTSGADGTWWHQFLSVYNNGAQYTGIKLQGPGTVNGAGIFCYGPYDTAHPKEIRFEQDLGPTRTVGGFDGSGNFYAAGSITTPTLNAAGVARGGLFPPAFVSTSSSGTAVDQRDACLAAIIQAQGDGRKIQLRGGYIDAGTGSVPSSGIGTTFTNGKNLTIEGEGPGNTIIRGWPNQTGPLFAMVDGTFSARLVLRNLTIDARGQSAIRGQGWDSCSLRGWAEVIMENVVILNDNRGYLKAGGADAASDCCLFLQCGKATVRNCTFVGGRDSGIYASANPGNVSATPQDSVVIDGCWFVGCNTGAISKRLAKSMNVINCHFIYCESPIATGIAGTPGMTGSYDGGLTVVATGNHMYRCGFPIRCPSQYGSRISNNKMVECGFDTAQYFTDGTVRLKTVGAFPSVVFVSFAGSSYCDASNNVIDVGTLGTQSNMLGYSCENQKLVDNVTFVDATYNRIVGNRSNGIYAFFAETNGSPNNNDVLDNKPVGSTTRYVMKGANSFLAYRDATTESRVFGARTVA